MNTPTPFFNIYDHLGLESYSIREGLNDSDWDVYAEAIEQLLQKYSISPELIAEVEETYAEIVFYLNEELKGQLIEFQFYPQGSLSQKTTVKSASSNIFDLDLIARLESGVTISPLTLLQLVEETLKKHDEFGKNLEAKNRCVMLPLPGKSFTVDITPGVPVKAGWESPDWSEDSDPLLVGDRNEPPHKPSNPRGFTSWLNSIANLVPPCMIAKSAVRESSDTYASADPIPDQDKPLHDVLRRTIQLLKLHRDAYYRKHENFEHKRFKPISILMTTLATRAYENSYNKGHQSPIELMLEVIESMPNYINQVPAGYSVQNPTIKGENFADKWNDPETGHLRAENFVKWHRDVCKDIRELLTNKDPQVIRGAADRAFGSFGLALSTALLGLLAEAVEAQNQTAQSSEGLLGKYLNTQEPTDYKPAPRETPHA